MAFFVMNVSFNVQKLKLSKIDRQTTAAADYSVKFASFIFSAM